MNACVGEQQRRHGRRSRRKSSRATHDHLSAEIFSHTEQEAAWACEILRHTSSGAATDIDELLIEKERALHTELAVGFGALAAVLDQVLAEAVRAGADPEKLSSFLQPLRQRQRAKQMLRASRNSDNSNPTSTPQVTPQPPRSAGWGMVRATLQGDEPRQSNASDSGPQPRLSGVARLSGAEPQPRMSGALAGFAATAIARERQRSATARRRRHRAGRRRRCGVTAGGAALLHRSCSRRGRARQVRAHERGRCAHQENERVGRAARRQWPSAGAGRRPRWRRRRSTTVASARRRRRFRAAEIDRALRVHSPASPPRRRCTLTASAPTRRRRRRRRARAARSGRARGVAAAAAGIRSSRR